MRSESRDSRKYRSGKKSFFNIGGREIGRSKEVLYLV